jgi:hypothetical protein
MDLPQFVVPEDELVELHFPELGGAEAIAVGDLG